MRLMLSNQKPAETCPCDFKHMRLAVDSPSRMGAEDITGRNVIAHTSNLVGFLLISWYAIGRRGPTSALTLGYGSSAAGASSSTVAT